MSLVIPELPFPSVIARPQARGDPAAAGHRGGLPDHGLRGWRTKDGLPRRCAPRNDGRAHRRHFRHREGRKARGDPSAAGRIGCVRRHTAVIARAAGPWRSSSRRPPWRASGPRPARLARERWVAASLRSSQRRGGASPLPLSSSRGRAGGSRGPIRREAHRRHTAVIARTAGPWRSSRRRCAGTTAVRRWRRRAERAAGRRPWSRPARAARAPCRPPRAIGRSPRAPAFPAPMPRR